MEAIRIKNLRNLQNTGFIKVKPVTFLLGSNSSGKSTFLRSFPLMKQSVATRTTGPILWYGDLVDFGGFNEALNNKSSAREICFGYHFKLPKSSPNDDHSHNRYLFYRAVTLIEDVDIEIELKMTTEEKRKNTTICKGIEILAAGHKISIEIDLSGEVTEFKVNESNILNRGIRLKADQANGFLPQIFRLGDEDETIDASYYSSSYYIRNKSIHINDLKEIVQKLVHHKTSQEQLGFLIKGFGLGSSKAMLASMKSTNRGGKTWKKKIEEWSEDSDDFKCLRDLIIANFLLSIMLVCDDYLSYFSRNVSYIGPVRATAERYYRSQDLAVGEVDSQGKNLAMFIRNLTEAERRDFATWTEKHFGFSVSVRPSGDHVSLRIQEGGMSSGINLADTGFGFSQILPILTQLWWLGRKPNRSGVRSRYPITFAIEQPELHLHPKLQALLADSFIAAINTAKSSSLDLRLIIETHSETLINRMGHRIANGDFDKDNVNVVLFDKQKSNEPVSIRTASYDEEGFLDNWPLGFFEPDMI
ncbi:AAA family ATPase [Trichocoleus desertorum AS-A10]|uniref:AAA family ATPase n=1 Tax=Trichocoleus desertorum TaxID=1481672 RepID=UPI003298CE67